VEDCVQRAARTSQNVVFAIATPEHVALQVAAGFVCKKGEDTRIQPFFVMTLFISEFH